MAHDTSKVGFLEVIQVFFGLKTRNSPLQVAPDAIQ